MAGKLTKTSDTPLWPRIRHYMREPFAEFWGCLILLLLGDGVVAQVTLSGGDHGDYQSINWGWGLAVMLGVITSGGISGGHLNPAVTLSSCIYRGFPWKKFPIYMLAQFLGCMVGSALVYGHYHSAIDFYEGGNGIRTVGLPTSSAGIFATYPQPWLTIKGQFFSEVITTAVLQFMIFAINDQKNMAAGPLAPLMLFFILFAIGCCLGYPTGYAMNFARDFGARLVSSMIGYGGKVWSTGTWYFWVPIIAPFIGGVLGGFMYDLFMYTGDESPVNWPYMGFDRLLYIFDKKHKWPRIEHDMGMVEEAPSKEEIAHYSPPHAASEITPPAAAAAPSESTPPTAASESTPNTSDN
ncbi:putative membrane protein [Yarrowia sp. C11]|nr:putative membrane protein [Yarrowia sp. C11]KAG5365063.1 putative membrane protein [Yarrowia sp. E02]